MVPPVGIIITVTVLVAASLAAYENPHVRAWIDRTRQKIAMGLHSLGDEIQPKPRLRRTSTDISMHEEKGDQAEARRKKALAEIMERGRIMEERRKRAVSASEQPKSPSFDTMVDENGELRSHDRQEPSLPPATSSGADTDPSSGSIRQRKAPQEPEPEPEQNPSALHQSVDGLLPLRHLPQPQPNQDEPDNPFESRYEREMREAWNIPLSDRRIEIPSSHASESLIELTPTTEDVPDPDFSVPPAAYLHRPLDRSEYFSAAASNSTHTLSDSESQPSSLDQSTLPNPTGQTSNHPLYSNHTQSPSTPSIDESASHIHASEAEDSADDILSEIGDGIRTPASVWTEVDSTVSGDFNL